MKKIVSTLLMAIIILCSCIVSNAANEANLSLTSNSTTVDVGSQITLYLQLDSLSGISTVLALSTVLDYDKDVFELVSITGENAFNVMAGNRVSATHADGVTNGKIFKVILKAIKKPESGKAALTLKEISVVDEDEEYSLNDISYAINVKDSVVTPGNNTVNNNAGNTNKPVNEDKNTPVQNTNDGTTANSKLPATGLDITIALFILLALVIGIASFVRYKKLKIK